MNEARNEFQRALYIYKSPDKDLTNVDRNGNNIRTIKPTPSQLEGLAAELANTVFMLCDHLLYSRDHLKGGDETGQMAIAQREKAERDRQALIEAQATTARQEEYKNMLDILLKCPASIRERAK